MVQLDEPLTSFRLRTAASWINSLMASFVFSSSSTLCFSLNKAWRGRQRHRVSERGNKCWKPGRQIVETNDGGVEKGCLDWRTWSFCNAASSATWMLSRTLASASYFSSSKALQRACSSPTFLSHTACSLRTVSASWDVAFSLTVEEKELTARSGWKDYRFILATLTARRATVQWLNVFWFFTFFFWLRKTVWEDQVEKPTSKAGKVDRVLDKGWKIVSVCSPGL